MASGAQRRMIEGLWRELSYKDSDIFAKQSLRKFLKQKFNVEDTSFLTKEKATKVIQAITRMERNLKDAAASV